MSIEINNLSLGYQDKLVVKNLSLKFPKNKVIALIGPNGCCKSTTLKAVARLLKPKQAQSPIKVRIFGKKALKNMPKNWLFSRSNTWYPKGLKCGN